MSVQGVTLSQAREAIEIFEWAEKAKARLDLSIQCKKMCTVLFYGGGTATAISLVAKAIGLIGATSALYLVAGGISAFCIGYFFSKYLNDKKYELECRLRDACYNINAWLKRTNYHTRLLPNQTDDNGSMTPEEFDRRMAKFGKHVPDICQIYIEDRGGLQQPLTKDKITRIAEIFFNAEIHLVHSKEFWIRHYLKETQMGWEDNTKSDSADKNKWDSVPLMTPVQMGNKLYEEAIALGMNISQ